MADEAQEKEQHFDSTRLKRFIIHVAAATKNLEKKRAAKEEVQAHVERLKQAVSEKIVDRSEVRNTVSALDESLKKVLHDEEEILRSQKRETKELGDLKTRLDSMNEKLMGIGREYAAELDAKDNEIEELKLELAKAKAQIEEHEQQRDDRRERLAQVEAKIQEHHEAKKKEAIHEVASKLKELEKTHKKLEKAGQHPKTHLNKLKKMIDTHKKTLAEMKKAK